MLAGPVAGLAFSPATDPGDLRRALIGVALLLIALLIYAWLRRNRP